MEKITKNDFVELKFTGKINDGEIFDTNIPEEAKKIDLKIDDKQFIICVGQKMVVEGLDNALEGKEIGKKHIIEITPEKAFGPRRKDLVKLIPLSVFTEQKISPQAGMTLHMDNNLVRIASVSGGRVLVDFNNPLSGKEIVYEFIITKKIIDDKEKIDSLLNYFIKKQIPYKLEGKKATFEADQFIGQMITMLNDKFNKVLGIEFIVKEKDEGKK
jgi:FKBP-type peptidyl-prolyl cis-trans isomerase 2